MSASRFISSISIARAGLFAAVCLGLIRGAAGTPARREYDVLRAFPPGRLAALSSGDMPDAQGFSGGNRNMGRWIEAGAQRGSCRAVLAAVVNDDLERADRAWRGIDVTFAHQRADGGFTAEPRPNGGSSADGPAAVETSYFFLQELGRAILVIRQSPHAAHFRERITALEPKLRLACDFLAKGESTILPKSRKAVNRVFIAAKAFGTCGLVLGDTNLVATSRRLVAEALQQRDAEGVFLEHGGRDSSYNAASLLFAQVLALHVSLPELDAALPAAARWQISRVLPSGEVDAQGNTRTGVGKEPGYDGQPKRINTTEVILALTLHGIVYQDARAVEAAERVFAWTRRESGGGAGGGAGGGSPAKLAPTVPPSPDAPLGPAGKWARYRLADPLPGQTSAVTAFTIELGSIEADPSGSRQWLHLAASRSAGPSFDVWWLTRTWPSTDVKNAASQVSRYLLREAGESPLEFADSTTGRAVLPSTGAWPFLLPQSTNGPFTSVVAPEVLWLGRRYELEGHAQRSDPAGPPADVQRLELRPDVLIGVPSNRRTIDDRRRYDRSDYPTARLTRSDYAEMMRAGVNCFRVDAEQGQWLRREPVFVWGESAAEVKFPEALFRSTWLGPAIFLDEPAVGTRDYVLRPRLTNDLSLRRTISPQYALAEFQAHYREVLEKGAPWGLIRGLGARPDVGLGSMHFPQRNLYVWETMADTAAWELSAGEAAGPCAFVFEPPGRVGGQRTLPEMNLAYEVQLPPGDAANLLSIIAGFARGAARLTGKDWGLSIYGGVDRSDAPLWLTRAYDEGARYFFFWDNYELACVPYSEILALARHLDAHVRSHPERNLPRLRRAAESAILLPPGYGLGHVLMGRGNLWGLNELHLERTNRLGVTYRRVMRNFFTEIERCLRQGTAFDLLWDLEGHPPDGGYREVVRCREDGRVEVRRANGSVTLEAARLPERPEGQPPGLEVAVEPVTDSPRRFVARATVTEGVAPIYYTLGADAGGVYRNVQVLWELLGPEAADYRALLANSGARPKITSTPTGSVVTLEFETSGSGLYRLRAATTDVAGRSTVVWKEFQSLPRP